MSKNDAIGNAVKRIMQANTIDPELKEQMDCLIEDLGIVNDEMSFSRVHSFTIKVINRAFLQGTEHAEALLQDLAK